MNKAEISKKLLEQSLSAGGGERLRTDVFEGNDSYKVTYRFLGNLTQQWRELGMDHFPTEKEAIEIAQESHPYFAWLFNQERELEGFKSTYQFHADVWRKM